MADDKVALEIFIEADKANLCNGWASGNRCNSSIL